jgi:hypothetical protein
MIVTHTAGGAPELAFERHYSPAELAEIWGVSENTVRRIFQDQPDVLKISKTKKGKRAYETLRIPASVVRRVHVERSK